MLLSAFVARLYDEAEILAVRSALMDADIRAAALADSCDTLNAKLADAEAQAAIRLKGWRADR